LRDNIANIAGGSLLKKNKVPILVKRSQNKNCYEKDVRGFSFNSREKAREL